MKISIVTPSFNQREFLEDTIRSVVEQEYPDVEYFVIDGGSTDGSVDIIKKYCHRITYWTSEPDGGQYCAINKGFSRSTGEIMGWINSSDAYYPWTFETVVEVFTQFPDVQWISGVASNFDVGRAPRHIDIAFPNRYDFLAGNCTLQQESIFWRRSLWERAGAGLNESVKYAADTELWFRFFQLAPLYYVNTLLGGFRYHGDRRGECEGKYHNEVAAICERFVKNSSLQDRIRGALFAQMHHSGVALLRMIMQRVHLWSWDRCPQIVRDFDTHTWKIRYSH
jgi:glycosyltransferase involved in cell wall biosynthesis